MSIAPRPDLVWIRFTGTNNPDEVIGKLRMHAGHVDLRHVAGSAVCPCLWTNGAGWGRSKRFASLEIVATQASNIIRALIPIQRFVRVMTNNAGETAIALSSPTTTLFQTIRLESNIDRSVRLRRRDDIHRSSVTSSAEINRIDGVQTCRIQNAICSLNDLFVVLGDDMIETWAMTCFATDTRDRA